MKINWKKTASYLCDLGCGSAFTKYVFIGQDSTGAWKVKDDNSVLPDSYKTEQDAKNAASACAARMSEVEDASEIYDD